MTLFLSRGIAVVEAVDAGGAADKKNVMRLEELKET